jgi:demethylmenaquinone methyltransferase/2-methoxy-6-polyprenyl-1,4-benzoquinol methylase
VSSAGQQIDEQLRYYRARAAEYDDTSPLGPQRPERRTVPVVAERLGISGDVLELACGTGIWTVELERYADSLTAVDGAPEMLDLARGRLAGTAVEFVCADLFRADVFDPAPPASYDLKPHDTVFSAFFISHIPPARFADFWALVGRALRPGGRAVMIDEAPARADLERVIDGHVATRTLSDGSEHRIVKIFYEPDRLVSELASLGWSATVSVIEHGWLLVEATRQP